MKSPLFRRLFSLALLLGIGALVSACVVEPAPGPYYYHHPHYYYYP